MEVAMQTKRRNASLSPVAVCGRRRFLTWLASAMTGVAGLSERAMAAAPGAPPLALEQLGDGVYAYRGAHALMSEANQGGICNLGLVIGADSAAVIDCGGSILEARAFIAAIKQVTDKPIRHAIITHMHPDHVFGAAAFRDLGAEIVGHRNLPRALEARRDFYLQRFRGLMGESAMAGVDIVPPSLLVENEMELDLGGRVLDLRAWKPAHTDNDLTVLDRASKILFTGDLVFLEHLPTIDGSLLGWMRQLDALAAIGASAAVPGHGPLKASWPQALDPERRYLEVLARDLRTAITKGVPIGEAVKTAAQSERGHWELFDEYNERNATAGFAELEWE
jgi:quinoprotein relay system zinc metallohydrolase 2